MANPKAAAMAALIFMLGTVDAAHAQKTTATAAADDWTFSVTPYLWFPAFKGRLEYALPPGAGSPTTSVDETRPFEGLDAAFMIAGEARHGPWSLRGDYVYLKLSTSRSAIKDVDFNLGAPAVDLFGTTANAGTETRLEGSLLSLAGGYSLIDTAEVRVDAVGGMRYLDVKARTNWRLSAAVSGPGPGQSFAALGEVSRNADILDAIIGVRGHLKLAERWSLPYYADIGAGASKLTWQAAAGLAYAFPWGEVAVAYRHLAYEQKDSKLLQDFKFGGPMVSASIRF